MFLDSMLNFSEHVETIIQKTNKTIKRLCDLHAYFTHNIQIICSTSSWLYNTNSFQKKIESIQHNAVLDITGAIGGSSKEKLYQELGSVYQQQRP